ncbi:ankyrin repeat domain-containing protein [Solemya elarraichensis gill symbiont]|uniref:Uncharacterized protein n=1 Tax=Solemya elarraichensis gill symbiont TaxID=1918949 RepID=A0A1T2KWI8_9GAMM|nr:ankyrin repeat domain-containing protein [Solemya elarraichensis gill symbiont]OOZ37184.1 hypothetical protein BOW52_10335 [Solemya elarraichensis gill symbiont]
MKTMILDCVDEEYANAAKYVDWPAIAKKLKEYPGLINTSRESGYTVLHHVAHAGLPVKVAQFLVELGAWRSVMNYKDEKPIDVAIRRRHKHLIEVLKPKLYYQIPPQDLLKIQLVFTEFIKKLCPDETKILQLGVLFETKLPQANIFLPKCGGTVKINFVSVNPPFDYVVNGFPCLRVYPNVNDKYNVYHIYTSGYEKAKIIPSPFTD